MLGQTKPLSLTSVSNDDENLDLLDSCCELCSCFACGLRRASFPERAGAHRAGEASHGAT